MYMWASPHMHVVEMLTVITMECSGWALGASINLSSHMVIALYFDLKILAIKFKSEKMWL